MNSTSMLMELGYLRHNWGWFLALGIIQIVIGIVALGFMPAATIGTVLVFGWLMLVGGIVEAVYAFRSRGGGGFLLHLAGAVLGVLIGLLVVTHPVAGALAWTLLFASLFTVGGLFHVIAAASLRYPKWGWSVFDGAITLLLGIMLWAEWPVSGFWFLGLALGVSLVLRGWSHVMFALAVRKVKSQAPIRRVA
ncbi:MAG TPA: HdeD family acid-resistance protein [Clostridia bacterium]|nr:HdeD family acid-resistance protein [Clostridia bacterium]